MTAVTVQELGLKGAQTDIPTNCNSSHFPTSLLFQVSAQMPRNTGAP